MPQDQATGPDGKSKNAKPIKLDGGEAKVRGIVTYPGGDRIDWRSVELPKDSTGKLSLRLTWTPPRPGLAVGMDVFDQYGRQVVSEKGKKANVKRSRRAEIDNASGTYLIRVYAPFRGDAGAYTLKLAYVANGPGGGPGWPPPDMEIPDPPPLPQVPTPAAPCDATNYKTNPAGCGGFCPDPPDMTWKGCRNVCPMVPDINIKACRDTMDCPDPPDTRVKKCKGVAIRECAPGEFSTTCKPPPPLKPIRGKIENIKQLGTKVEIRIDKGTKQKVDVGWLGRLLDSRGKPVAQSDFTVTKVAEKSSWGQVDLTSDQVSGKTVELRPPP